MIESLIIALCLVLSALLAGAEMAVVSVSRPRIREAARQDAGRGKSDGSRIRRDTDWLSLDAWRIHVDSRDSERNINHASFRSCALVLRQVPLSPSLLDLFRLFRVEPGSREAQDGNYSIVVRLPGKSFLIFRHILTINFPLTGSHAAWHHDPRWKGVYTV